MSEASEALSAVRRSSQVYYGQLAEPETLSAGVALTCPRYPNYYDGNHLREGVIPAGKDPQELYDEVQAFYIQQGLRCFRWVPAAGQDPEPIGQFLAARGYSPITNLAMQWVRETTIPVSPRVRLLPARAMRKALREVIFTREHYTPETREMIASVALDRLDSPQYDLFVAMLGDRPAGHGALFQVGEIGRIENVFVAEPFRRQGVAQTLVAHLLALARRLALRITCLETEESNLPAQTLYRNCGFEVGGSFVEFIAPEAIREGLFHLSVEQ